MKDNILVVTPMYKIVNRKDLIQDSECIYTLVKYWTEDYNVDILYNYINGFSKIKNIFSNNKISKIINGYNYECGETNVVITERQNLFPKQTNGLKIDKYMCKKIINKYKLIKKYKFVTIHLPSTSQYLIKNLNFIENKFAILHQTDLQYLRKNQKKFKRYLEENFDKVYCRSLAIYNEVKGYEIKNLKPDIISSGVNTIPLKNEKKFENNNIKILYVGKLIKRKNLDILIKALYKFNNIKWSLDIIGTGPMEKNYKKLSEKLNLNKKINFLGHQKHEDVLEKMEKSDIFCMPSINETLGLVYLEAMSKGCLTIGTKNEGIDGIIINNKNGFLINPNTENLYECINKIFLLDISQKRKISEEAIETAKKCSEIEKSKYYLECILKNKKL